MDSAGLGFSVLYEITMCPESEKIREGRGKKGEKEETRAALAESHQKDTRRMGGQNLVH